MASRTGKRPKRSSLSKHIVKLTRAEKIQIEQRKAVYAQIKLDWVEFLRREHDRALAFGHWCLKFRREIFRDPEFIDPFRDWLRETERTDDLELFDPEADDDLQTIENVRREADALGFPELFAELDAVLNSLAPGGQAGNPARTVDPEDIIPEPPPPPPAPRPDFGLDQQEDERVASEAENGSGTGDADSGTALEPTPASDSGGGGSPSGGTGESG